MKMYTKVVVAAGIAVAALAINPAVAGADLSDADVAKYGQDSWRATCRVLSDNLTGDVLEDIKVTLGVQQDIADEYGVNPYTDAAEVMNYQVYYYCAEHWPTLQAVYKYARGQLELVPEDVRRQFPLPSEAEHVTETPRRAT